MDCWAVPPFFQDSRCKITITGYSRNSYINVFYIRQHVIINVSHNIRWQLPKPIKLSFKLTFRLKVNNIPIVIPLYFAKTKRMHGCIKVKYEIPFLV
ncbi:hypothetical protein BOQ57_19305 [Aeromonas hydrophila]|nr:hypothetical protein BOQ57_19305 [Aeromonas hydrophila]